MYKRVLAGSALAVVLVSASPAPAAAAVRYDPEAKTGFVGAGDLRRAFGWSVTTLAERASGMVFDHDFRTEDTYAVSCGAAAAFPVVHHRVFGRFELADAVVRATGRAAAAGYGGRLLGFRLTGPRSGISGTSVAPAVGQPCPREGSEGSTIAKVVLLSSTDGWTLTARSGDDSREIRRG
jgi:hypothetical protein